VIQNSEWDVKLGKYRVCEDLHLIQQPPSSLEEPPCRPDGGGSLLCPQDETGAPVWWEDVRNRKPLSLRCTVWRVQLESPESLEKFRLVAEERSTPPP